MPTFHHLSFSLAPGAFISVSSLLNPVKSTDLSFGAGSDLVTLSRSLCFSGLQFHPLPDPLWLLPALRGASVAVLAVPPTPRPTQCLLRLPGLLTSPKTPLTMSRPSDLVSSLLPSPPLLAWFPLPSLPFFPYLSLPVVSLLGLWAATSSRCCAFRENQ